MSTLTLQYVFRSGFVVALVGAFLVEAACDGDGSSHDLDSNGDAGPSPITIDAQPPDSQADLPMSTMRIAHLAPGLGPLDFCYQGAKKGTFVGPVLGGGLPPAPPAGDAGDADLDAASDAADSADAEAGSDPNDADGGTLRSASYRTVSKYQNLQAAGPITIAILEAGSTSCATPLATGDVTLDPGKLSTVGVFARPSDGGLAFEIAAFTDDPTTEPSTVRVRIIHAALGKAMPGQAEVVAAGPLGVRAVAAKTTVLADRVDPRHAGSASQAVMVDALGYVTAPPIPSPASIAIGPATTAGGADAGFDPWQSQDVDLDLRGGSLHTAFVLSGATDSTFEVLWCADLTTSDDQTLCRIVY